MPQEEVSAITIGADKDEPGNVLIEFADISVSVTADQARQMAEGLKISASVADKKALSNVMIV